MAATASAIAVIAVCAKGSPRIRPKTNISATTAQAISASRLPRASSWICSGVSPSAVSASSPAI
jgi:hypothetical protein